MHRALPAIFAGRASSALAPRHAATVAAGKDPRAKLQQLYRERDPLYRETAHFVIETGRPTVQTLVGMILMQLELAGVVDASRVPSAVEPPR